MKKATAVFILLVNPLFGGQLDLCSGIKSELQKIQVLAGVSAGASGVGTLTGATALATGIMKNKADKEIMNLENMNQVELYKYAESLEKEADALKEEKQKLEQLKHKSQTLGNVRTGTMAATSVTSVVSAVTTGFGVKNLDDLINKMNACNEAISKLESEQIQMRFDGLEGSDEYVKISSIIAKCRKFDVANMQVIKNAMTASTVISGIGGAAGIAGAITSAIAVSKEKQAETMAGANTKGLNMAANISAGVATATSATSLILGAVSLSKLNKDAENAESCESAL